MKKPIAIIIAIAFLVDSPQTTDHSFIYRGLLTVDRGPYTLRPMAAFLSDNAGSMSQSGTSPEHLNRYLQKYRRGYQEALIQKEDYDKEARIIKRIMDYLNRNRRKPEIKVVSYGSGAGQVLHSIKQRIREDYGNEVKVTTVAADYDSAAIELAREKDKEYVEENRIDEFRIDNLLKLAGHKEEYDAIILEDVLHEVFSFAKPRNSDDSIEDLKANKDEVKRVFKDLCEQLLPGGILIIEDRVTPDFDKDKLVKIRLSEAARDPFKRYFEGFSYFIEGRERKVRPFNAVTIKQRPIVIEDRGDNLVVELRLGDYLHFLSHLRVLLPDKCPKGDYSRWEIDRREVVCFYTEGEYRKALTEAGFIEINFSDLLRKKPVTQYVEVLNPDDFPGIIDEERKGFKISANIVAYKRTTRNVSEVVRGTVLEVIGNLSPETQMVIGQAA